MAFKLRKIKNNIRKFIPKPIINYYHYLLAFVGAVKYKFPSRNLIVIGVTGTKGKTTVCYLIYDLLYKLGIKTAISSSDAFLFDGEASEKISRSATPGTTPGRWFLQKFLKEALNKNCEVAVLEITSEGLMQNRHSFIDFDIVEFINIHPEHIEHHGGYEKYKESKAKLFLNLLKGKNKYFRGKMIKKTIIANLDDKESDYFLNFPAQEKITYSIEVDTGNESLNIHPEKIQLSPKGVTFKINDLLFASKLIGNQGVYNILASFVAIKSIGIPISDLKQPLAEFNGLPGRFEMFQSRKCRVIIDYAHTPVSVEELYKNILEIFKPRKLLCLIGSDGGCRDKWKRPVIGEIAAKYCSKIVISDVNPYDEDPFVIMRAIEQGVKKYFEAFDFKKDYEIIQDRKEAILNLVNSAEKEDIIVTIGKGVENTIEMNGYSIPWNEKEVVLEILGSSKYQQKIIQNIAPEFINGVNIKKINSEKVVKNKVENKAVIDRFSKSANIISKLFAPSNNLNKKTIKPTRHLAGTKLMAKKIINTKKESVKKTTNLTTVPPVGRLRTKNIKSSKSKKKR